MPKGYVLIGRGRSTKKAAKRKPTARAPAKKRRSPRIPTINKSTLRSTITPGSDQTNTGSCAHRVSVRKGDTLTITFA